MGLLLGGVHQRSPFSPKSSSLSSKIIKVKHGDVFVESFWHWVETLGTLVKPNANRRRARNIGRRILALIVSLNLFIFAANVFWLKRDLMKTEDESVTRWSVERARKLAFSSSSTTTNANDDESTNTPQKRAQRAIYERREGIHDPKKQQRAIISVRSFDIDPISGEFIPKKEIRKQPEKYFVTHPVLVSGVCSKTLPSVRELVGSMHFWHPEVIIWLYEVGPSITDDSRQMQKIDSASLYAICANQ